MNAELIAVGSELLRFGKRDSNAEWIHGQLESLGVEVVARSIVEDHVARIASVVHAALGRADVVVMTGGLGSTADDRTREALRLALEPDPQRGVPEGPPVVSDLANVVGLAQGVLVRRAGRLLFALPGVPHEMRAMFESGVVPELRPRPRSALATRSLRIAGRRESDVDREIASIGPVCGVTVTTLAGIDGVDVWLRGEAADEAQARHRVSELAERIRARLGPDVYGDADSSLAGAVGVLLRERGWTLASAESCTAGLLGAVVTSVPGSSAWYRGGFVVYDDELKQRLAGVEPATLAAHGAVSEPVARELARGARERCSASIGVGITGIAGPGGATPGKPVGSVHVALDDGRQAGHWALQLRGDRDAVRRRSVAAALDRLRRHVLGRA